MTEHSDIPISLRKRVFKLLDKDPLLKPKEICKLLDGVDYKQNGEVVSQYKKQWKKEYKSQRGLIRSCPDDVHNAFYKGDWKVVRMLVGCLFGEYISWKSSNAKNRFLFFKSTWRIRFFETGTVELWVRKPANHGKVMQLFCDAFTWTKLIDSIRS